MRLPDWYFQVNSAYSLAWRRYKNMRIIIIIIIIILHNG